MQDYAFEEMCYREKYQIVDIIVITRNIKNEYKSRIEGNGEVVSPQKS